MAKGNKSGRSGTGTATKKGADPEEAVNAKAKAKYGTKNMKKGAKTGRSCC